MNPRVLFKSYGKCWSFCFNKQLTQLGSGCNFQPAFCGLWFQCQFHFQSLCNALQILPARAPPGGQCGMWVMVYLSLYFLLKDFGVKFTHVTLKCEPRDLSTIRSLPKLLSLFHVPSTFWLLEFPFQSSSQKKNRKEKGKFSHSLGKFSFLILEPEPEAFSWSPCPASDYLMSRLGNTEADNMVNSPLVQR